jgi:hypothetical protein
VINVFQVQFWHHDMQIKRIKKYQSWTGRP